MKQTRDIQERLRHHDDTPQIVTRLGASAAAGSVMWALTGLNSTSKIATIGPGWIVHGVNAPVYFAGGTVTITGGTTTAPHYAVLEYNHSSHAVTLYGSAFSTYPQGEPPDIFRFALHSFYVSAGLAYHLRQNRHSDIDITGWAN